MAGYGQPKTNTYVEECWVLPVNDLKDPLKGTAPRRGHYQPADQPGGISYVVEDRDPPQQVRLVYQRNNQIHRQTVEVTRRAMPRGGHRWFWVGPTCSDRKEKLYRPPGETRFRCRECAGLTYASTGRSQSRWYEEIQRWARKLRKICDELEVSDTNLLALPGTPERPTHMHEETYKDLLSDYQRLHRRVLRGIRRAFRSGRYGSSDESTENKNDESTHLINQPLSQGVNHE